MGMLRAQLMTSIFFNFNIFEKSKFGISHPKNECLLRLRVQSVFCKLDRGLGIHALRARGGPKFNFES
jgi:hypothetical protein